MKGVFLDEMDLECSFSNFLNTYCLDRPHLLLALSGGSDSLALFHLLLSQEYPFEVAHVDHGWREESQEEASYLKTLCQRHSIPFHLKKLIPPDLPKNLEDQARRERLVFFREILEREGLKGVLLAHHADDQAETVLKRVFEGAALTKLRGLVPKIEVEGITLYRPLLQVKKRVIQQWLEKRKIAYFTDPTNTNARFLRSRLRQEILPSLSLSFGKEINLSLCKLGESAAELGDFIEDFLAPYREKIVRNERGVTFDFTLLSLSSPFLWKCLIKEFFAWEGLLVNHATLETIFHHLQQGSCDKKVEVEGKWATIHQKRLTLLF